MVSMPFDEPLQRGTIEWGLRSSGRGDDAPMPGHVYAFARSGDYLVIVSGERHVVDELIDSLDVKGLVQP